MKKWTAFLGLNIVLVFLDQFTKYLAQKHLMGVEEGTPVIDGVFRLLYHENSGAAFGILQNKIIYFIIGTFAVLAGICYFYHKLPDTRYYLPLKVIAIFLSAGAIGNLIDRIINNYVIDFFYFELINFPIFNIADCYVTVSGTFLFLFVMFRYKKDDDFDFLKWKRDRVNE